MQQHHITPSGAAQEANELLSAREAAQRLGVSKGTIYGLISSGQVTHFRIGKCVRIKESDLSEYLESTCVKRAQHVTARRFYGRYPKV